VQEVTGTALGAWIARLVRGKGHATHHRSSNSFHGERPIPGGSARSACDGHMSVAASVASGHKVRFCLIALESRPSAPGRFR
jgi:hypothetical protein